MPSLHLIGEKDQQLAKLIATHNQFNGPVVVSFGEGHKFPRTLSDEAFEKVKDFVQEHYFIKNGLVYEKPSDESENASGLLT